MEERGGEEERIRREEGGGERDLENRDFLVSDV